MLSTCVARNLALFWFPLAALALKASDYYVAPEGQASGRGTISDPYDLSTALSGQASQPGDVFWLRGGDYKLGHIESKIRGVAGAPVTFRQVQGEKARVDGSLTLFDSNGYVVFRDFELYSSDTNRVSSLTNTEFNPPDLKLFAGVACYAPNLSFINLMIHDQTRHGIYVSEHGTNTLIYGCIIYNNGWASPDDAEGHGFYIQGIGGTRMVAENLVFNNSGANLHVYDNTANNPLVGVTLKGNVAFNAGRIQSVRDYRDWIIGVDFPSPYADQIIISENMGFQPPNSASHPEIQIGRDCVNGTVVLMNNYMPFPVEINNWRIMVVSGNLFSGRFPDPVISLHQTLSDPFAIWDNNFYTGYGLKAQFIHNQEEDSFSEWRESTGYDQYSTFLEGNLSGTKIFVRTNAYESGRAHIVVYNWDNLDRVPVDLSSVLRQGSVFEVRNAQDIFAPAVLSGVYNGQVLQLPMTNLTVAVPNGPLNAAPATGPTFNVFVLLPIQAKLQVSQTSGFLQVMWSTNYGAQTLQYKNDLTVPGGWTISTNTPVLLRDQFIVTEPAAPEGKFYRLQIQ